MRRAMVVLLGTCLLIGRLGAQRQQPATGETGSVTGHVYCSDTNLPARIASVTLQSINVKAESAPHTASDFANPLRTYQTLLDGSFSVPKVKPGTYYVVIQQPGYLSPITMFTQDELAKPTPEILARVLKTVPMVTVEASHTATLEVRLERGAAITGTIRYDDGSPVAATRVTMLSRGVKDRKLYQVLVPSSALTDDQGRYRITSLAPGEYLPNVSLELDEKYIDNIVGGASSMISNMKYALTFYAGDTVRKSAALSLKLEAGEQRDGVDITIPLSKLHRITGTIVDQANGHVVNSGKLALTYDDGIELTTTNVDKDDSEFHFDFVPEGEYTLTATNATDVVREETPNPPGSFPIANTKETMIKAYGPQHQPLVVTTDMPAVVVPVPPKNNAKPAAAP